MDSPKFLRPLCLMLAALAMAAGALGIVASFFFLASRNMGDVTAGCAGFLGGTILIAAGLVSMTMVSTRPVRSEQKDPAYSEIS